MQADVSPTMDETSESQAGVWLKRVAIALVILIVLGGIGYGIKSLLSGGAPHKKKITTIKLLPDTPPPPPPPPPKEPPKEQPKEQPKEIKVEQPKPVEAPPAENLKMEGAAGDGPSPFQAGQVTKDYDKGDVSTVKIAGKKGLAAFSWFTSGIDSHIKKALAEQKELNKAKYQVEVRITFSADGSISKAELLESTGDDSTDDLIRKVLASLPPMSEKAPDDMQRKVVIRVTSQNLG